MKILTTEQTRALDAASIVLQSIQSHELMERAAKACTERILALIPKEKILHVFCGAGNNGGDGLAIARLLIEQGRGVRVFYVASSEKRSQDCDTNWKLLSETSPEILRSVNAVSELQNNLSEEPVYAIDALLGTGLNRPAEGLMAEVIDFINQHYRFIISIDVPSGLFADKSSSENKSIIRSRLCLSFQFPKLAFLLPQNQPYVPEFELVDIGLSISELTQVSTNLYYVTAADIAALLKPRAKFSHKGQFGHGLLVAGSKGMSGAALIASEAALRSGAGLLTLHSVAETLSAMRIRLPEAMSSEDQNADCVSSLQLSDKYDCLAFGPGLGQAEETETVLKKILHYFTGPLLIDADGLNMLATNKTWLEFLPADTLLTPHPGEFERLTEKVHDDFDRLSVIRSFAMRYNCLLLYKGAHSIMAMPDGNLFFNSSGNPALAKGGSGDTLSGILLGLLCRGYTAPQALLIGTFVHGLAGDLCAEESSPESILASDVTARIGAAFSYLEKSAFKSAQ